MKHSIRNRIIDHVRVRAGDLVPHPNNFRTHPKRQKDALKASYRTIGFARSLLGYRLEDGRIQLIDGHLRRDLHPEMLVTVELLDVTDEEAKQLLLTIDPLAELAENDGKLLAELAAQVESASEVLNEFWRSLGDTDPLPPEPSPTPAVTEQFLVLVECTDEAQQIELLDRFQAEGLACKALVS